MNKDILLPASCTMLDEDEMIYIDGGAGIETFLITTIAVYVASQFLPQIISTVFTKVRDFFVSYKPMPLE